MLNLTPIARKILTHVDAEHLTAAHDAEATQRRLLARLVDYGRDTAYGRRYGLGSVTSYADFASRLPLVEYEDLRADVERMIAGERSVLCPGHVRRYAQSSGTSGGKSKYIPLPDVSLRNCHYNGSIAVVARYLNLYPDSRVFSGRAFILGGSYANELHLRRGVKVGDLSASLIDKINPIANIYRVPSKHVALMQHWEEKLPLLVESTLHANVTNLSGVPSWFLTVIRRVMERAGARELHEVWPGLEVFFHGGIAFRPYRREYDSLIDPKRMRYMETYNASEGFFALQADPASRAMMLLMDVDVFYEFIPVADLGSASPRVVPSWEVVKGEVYAMVITSTNGLWRYMIGDTVRIESTAPLTITIAGRTHSFINAFGEELMVYNADAALTRACAETGATVRDYTVAPVFASGDRRGRHQWLVAFGNPPADIEHFADILDAALCDENSDYQAKRSGGIFLDRLDLVAVPHDAFDRYLAATGRLGGQRKVPRLKNDRSVADAILALLEKNRPPK